MLEVRGIAKSFNAGTPNEVRALQGVDLGIDAGAFVIVIGGNGSGKSTLLNAVAGTCFVDAGTIGLDGRDLTRWPEHRRAALIGRVFQNPFSGTAADMSIAGNIALAARRGRRGRRGKRRRPSASAAAVQAHWRFRGLGGGCLRHGSGRDIAWPGWPSMLGFMAEVHVMQVNILEAKNQLSKLVKAAAAGREIVIASNGKPMAKLVPIAPSRRLGSWRSLRLSQARIDAAFTKEVDEEVARALRGES